MEKREPWWKCKFLQPLWRTVWGSLKKLKIELPYDPAIPLLGINLEKMKTLIWKDIFTPMFTAALFTIAKTWKQAKCPWTDKQIKNMWYTHTQEYYSAIKNDIGRNMEGPKMIILSEVSQTKKNKYLMRSLVCGIWKDAHQGAFGNVGRYFWLSCLEEHGVGEIREVAKHPKRHRAAPQHRNFLSKCQQFQGGEALPEGLNGGRGEHLGSGVLGFRLLPFPNWTMSG